MSIHTYYCSNMVAVKQLARTLTIASTVHSQSISNRRDIGREGGLLHLSSDPGQENHHVWSSTNG